jgi:hypothetical protein
MSRFTKTFELANRLAIKRGQDYSAVRAPLLSKEQMISALEGIRDSIPNDLANIQVMIARYESEYLEVGGRPEARKQVTRSLSQYRYLADSFIPNYYKPWLDDLIADLQTEAPPLDIDPEFEIPDNPVTKARLDVAKIIYELDAIDSQADRHNVRILFQSLFSIKELHRLARIQENGVAAVDIAPVLPTEPKEEPEPYEQQWNYGEAEPPELPAEPFEIQPQTRREPVPDTEREAGE